MSQGRILKIPDRKSQQDLVGDKERKRLNQEKVKTKQRQGW